MVKPFSWLVPFPAKKKFGLFRRTDYLTGIPAQMFRFFPRIPTKKRMRSMKRNAAAHASQTAARTMDRPPERRSPFSIP
jgi:hypothetical protein